MLYKSFFNIFFSLGCSPGYFGRNCTRSCPYPLYGEVCGGICECDKDSCDVSTGCRPITTGTHITFLHLPPQNTRYNLDNTALSRDKLSVASYRILRTKSDIH